MEIQQWSFVLHLHDWEISAYICRSQSLTQDTPKYDLYLIIMSVFNNGSLTSTLTLNTVNKRRRLERIVLMIRLFWRRQDFWMLQGNHQDNLLSCNFQGLMTKLFSVFRKQCLWQHLTHSSISHGKCVTTKSDDSDWKLFSLSREVPSVVCNRIPDDFHCEVISSSTKGCFCTCFTWSSSHRKVLLVTTDRQLNSELVSESDLSYLSVIQWEVQTLQKRAEKHLSVTVQSFLDEEEQRSNNEERRGSK
jgi:hypothetical protein